MTRLGFVLVALVLTSCWARAETLPLITPIPTEYTPGTPLTFALQAPNLVDVVSFNIDLIVTTSDPTTAPNLTLSAATPDPNLYVFGSGGSFSSSVTPGPNLNQLDLNIQGQAAAGQNANTGTGGSDLLTNVTLTPGLGLTDSITVSVNGRTLQFNTDGDLLFPVSAPPPFEIDLAPVPGPAAWVPFGLGGVVVVFARRRWDRRTA